MEQELLMHRKYFSFRLLFIPNCFYDWEFFYAFLPATKPVVQHNCKENPPEGRVM